MEIILLKDIENLGQEGQTVKVEDGYARNFLIPKKMAVLYTAGAVKVIEAKRRKAALKAEKEKNAAQELAKTISQLSLTIPVEAGVNDTLFGSVTADTIFNALQQEGIHIDKRNISIDEPIRKLGIYTVEVKLYPEVKENLKVWVVKK
ncbi:MAG: 50S ribosomal protein L9 [Omnitrophica bacterium RBG_13_46_9]|nr:MAG: 50S ribosomal protein L9 [Omnitrophica bacterium RBG_13_46_9]